jgi:hypothetical protein
MLENTTIHRHSLDVTDFQVLNLPTAHQILSVAPGRYQSQHYAIDLWVKVSPSDHNTDVGIWILGAGNPWPAYETNSGVGFTHDLDFIGTCVMNDGLVWHVFEGPVPQ